MSRLAVAILDWRPYPCKHCKPCTQRLGSKFQWFWSQM